ncbi:hypothetical protein [Sphingorhabdus sp. 109]|uniref:hypothetical protein n=1 Tax=Sphingorhabdus sp. 109 TaxID=2653173 RepID=UPI001358F6E2|nr:hypothetical protein [Sphingorhabdus sp. 109]
MMPIKRHGPQLTPLEGMARPIVYLDTQDFSRFGDEERNPTDALVAEIYRALLEFKRTNRATFVVSMPLLSELLQYHPDRRELAVSKAKAVEKLCGQNSIVFPSQLMAIEVAEAASKFNYGNLIENYGKFNQSRRWYSDVSDALSNIKNQINAAIDKEFAKINLEARWQRQRAKTLRKKITSKAILKSLREGSLDNELGLPHSLVQRVMTGLINQKMSPEEAVTELFEYVAQPERFIEYYFERLDTDRSLPFWIRNLGEDLNRSLSVALEKVAQFPIEGWVEEMARNLMKEQLSKYEKALFQLASDSIPLYLDSKVPIEHIQNDAKLLSSVPSIGVCSKLFQRYVEQALGLHGPKAKLEKSFGGDIVHAMYLPSVDLWRGDRRTSAALKMTSPEYSGNVVRKLSELPDAINQFTVQQ